MNLSQRDEQLTELMDAADCDPNRLRRTQRRFRYVNRAVSKWDTVYRSHLRPTFARLSGPTHARRPIRLLDVGCGGGDVLRRILGLARRDGFDVEALGIDPDPRALEVAETLKPMPGLSFLCTHSRDLVNQGLIFDVVISNHLLHHLDDAEFNALMSDCRRLGAQLSVHSDIARSRAAYALFSLASIPLAPRTFLRVDGLRSIRRSYTRDELQARLPDGWNTERAGRFRLLAVDGANVDSADIDQADRDSNGAR